MHERAFLFAENDAAQSALLVDVEDLDRQALFAAEREGGGVHHLEVGAERIVEGDFVELLRSRVFLRIGRIDASTRVPLSMTSASSSMPRSADAESVEK